jgi:hypothetical protein
MSYSDYVWSEPPSMTAMKYQRAGFVEKRPFLPGERSSMAREMENNVAGFREVSRNLSYARREASNQDRVRQSYSMERTPTTSYYKSVVGTRCRGCSKYEY